MFSPLVAVVDFHHARGPEIEKWFGVAPDEADPAATNDWLLLPFLALSDGAHASTEELSYFTLRQAAAGDGEPRPALFGIACTRQLPSSELLLRPAHVTRSSVQKAVVAIVESPYLFARIREVLSAVTKTWFAQKNFDDCSILEQFQESLENTCKVDSFDEKDQYFGLSLRELIHEYKQQTLVLLKCALLQPKACSVTSKTVPIQAQNTYERDLVPPTSLKTSERASLLAYLGLPLQLFGKGALFGPYTPLQQLDILSDAGTKSFVAGSTNSLLLQQNSRSNDVLVNLDEHSINVPSPTLKAAISLSASDRRFMDFLTQSVTETWDEAHPTIPNTYAYNGSEEFIRLQFEEYIIALLASVKYKLYVDKYGKDPKLLVSDQDGDPSNDFGYAFVESWMESDNYRIFNKCTDPQIFDIVEPRHPFGGGVSLEEIQRRLVQQVSALHLDERLSNGREAIGKSFATGQQRVTSAFATISANIEAMREQQRKRNEERQSAMATDAKDTFSPTTSNDARAPEITTQAVSGSDMSQAQASMQAASARAGAYFSSWGSWAAEKRKTGWNRSVPDRATSPSGPSLARTSTSDSLGKRMGASEEEKPDDI